MAYTKQTWADLPSKTTPINANRLNHIEDGIYDAAAVADNVAGAIGNLGSAAYKDSTNAVEAASTALVESGAVYYEINEVKQDLNDTDLAVGALQTSVTSLGKYKAEADSIAPVELDATGASQAYAVDDQFYLIDILLTATSPIAQNDAIVVYPTAGYNCKPSDSVTEQLKNLKENKIYGFHIASGESDPDKMVTYLADAVDATPAYMDYAADEFNYGSWGDAFFMPRPVMLKSNGTVDYYLNPDDYSKKVDGTASDIANTSYDGNAMMEWGRDGRKIWYKIVPDKGNTGASVFIANYQADEGYVDYPFHNSAGVSMPHFYTPIYNGSVISDKMRSLSGQAVSKSLTGTQEMEKAQANNPSGQYMWDIECLADRLLITFLLILMSRSVDTQAKFGQGANTGGSEAVNNTFRTGQHNAKGLFYGTNSGRVASNDFANIVKIFGMENWYGFQWRRTNGMILSDSAMKYKLTYGQEDGSSVTGYNTDGANYKTAGSTVLSGTSGNYISTEYFAEDGMFPCGELNGSSSSYYCDACWYNNSGARFALFGGSSGNGAKVGAFCCGLYTTVSATGGDVDAALSCKPLA